MKTLCTFAAVTIVWGGGAIVGAQEEPESALPPSAEAPTKQKVAVLEAVVSIDGGMRPDLGRSVADSLVAGFLRAGRMDVIDADARTGTDGQRLSAVEAGREATCDFVLVPTLVGEGEFYRLTVRQLAIPSGKVEQMFEETATGPLGELFELASRMAVRLASPPPRPTAVGPTPSGPIRAWMSGPTDVDLDPAEAPPTRRPGEAFPSPSAHRPGALGSAVEPSPPLRTIVLAGDRRVEIEEIGRVAALNMKYSFCVIEPHRGRLLQKGDRVLLPVSRGLRPTITAVVTGVERGHAIAEFQPQEGQQISAEALVYKWVPEAETQPSPGISSVPEPVPLH